MDACNSPPSGFVLDFITLVIFDQSLCTLQIPSDRFLRQNVLPCSQCRFDIFGLAQYGKGDYDGMDVFPEQQIMICLPNTSIIGIEVDFEIQCLGGFEGPRVNGFQGEL